MASTGATLPLTGASVPYGVSGGDVWNNPNNITTESGYSDITTSDSSQKLMATNFGFSLPVDAIINGIEITVSGFTTISSSGQDYFITKDGVFAFTGLTGNGKLTSSPSIITYGGSNDLWGKTWTASDVNTSTFGFYLSFYPSGTESVQIDYIKMNIYYNNEEMVSNSAFFELL